MTDGAGCSGAAGAPAAGAAGSCSGDKAAAGCKGMSNKCPHDCQACQGPKCETHGCEMGECKKKEGECKGDAAACKTA